MFLSIYHQKALWAVGTLQLKSNKTKYRVRFALSSRDATWKIWAFDHRSCWTTRQPSAGVPSLRIKISVHLVAYLNWWSWDEHRVVTHQHTLPPPLTAAKCCPDLAQIPGQSLVKRAHSLWLELLFIHVLVSFVRFIQTQLITPAWKLQRLVIKITIFVRDHHRTKWLRGCHDHWSVYVPCCWEPMSVYVLPVWLKDSHGMP